VRLLDRDPGAASRAAERLLRLLSGAGSAPAIPAIRPVGVDAREAKPLAGALAGSHAVLAALPPGVGGATVARAALAVRAHYCDLGGDGGAILEDSGWEPKRGRRACRSSPTAD
jgi:saccharopine dehydrogenase-like NADP-dependent oxidoreductase